MTGALAEILADKLLRLEGGAELRDDSDRCVGSLGVGEDSEAAAADRCVGGPVRKPLLSHRDACGRGSGITGGLDR